MRMMRAGEEQEAGLRGMCKMNRSCQVRGGEFYIAAVCV